MFEIAQFGVSLGVGTIRKFALIGTAAVCCASTSLGAQNVPKSVSAPAATLVKAKATDPKASKTASDSRKIANNTKKKSKRVQIGSASWYGKWFQGKPTASGDPYDMYQFTAAHRDLPLGTWLKVTNLRSGKWLIVKVNDRGPYVGDRIVDLSYASAKALDFKSRGLEWVKLEVVEPTTWAMSIESSDLK